METKQIKVSAAVHARAKQLAAERHMNINEVIGLALEHERTYDERLADQQRATQVMREGWDAAPTADDEAYASGLWEQIAAAQPGANA